MGQGKRTLGRNHGVERWNRWGSCNEGGTGVQGRGTQGIGTSIGEVQER